MKKELRAYIAAYVWMDVYLEKEVKDIWNTDPAKGLIHDIVRQHISLKHWEQIDRFFYASKPLPQGQKTPFDKLKPLSEHLRKKFKDYWHTGAHLAVDEATQRFMGRSKETVNLPSKPIPKGFNIWVVANHGYVLDWLYHAKSDDGGPVDLDDFWMDKRFS